jgi:hypothetical protein
MPGETCSTIKNKGINNLNKRKQVILAETLKTGTLVIKHCENGTIGIYSSIYYQYIMILLLDYKNKFQSHTIIMGKAPPPNSIHSQNQQLLTNKIIDHEGLLRL